MQVLRFDQLVNRSPQIEDLCRCMICLEIFIDPICCENCENHFCQTCITTWSQNQPPRSCPVCNKLKEKQGQRILKNMLNDLNVYCCYKLNGCLGILKYSDYFSHIKSCEYKMIKCECVGCNLDILVKDKYQHELICPFKLIKCRWCKLDTIRQNLQIHEMNECQQRCINCQLCQLEVSVLKMQEHLLQCPENLFTCKWCSGDIKIKFRDAHEQNDCPSILIQCLGCQQSFKRVELNAHIQQCQFVETECDNCQMLVQRKNLQDHNISKCFKNLKATITDQQRQIKGLISFCEELSQQMHLLQQKQSPKFSKSQKHKDIHIKNEGKVAFICNSDDKSTDRLVEIKNSKNKPLQLEFISLIENNVYVGIVSNQCDISFLFSGTGQVYLNKYKTKQDNNKQKHFGFVIGQKLELLYNDVFVSITNLNTKQNCKYNIPQDLFEEDEVEFHAVICLRQGSDRVRILN